MTIKSEVFVQGDSEGFDIVRQWSNGASNTNAWKGWVIAKFLCGDETDHNFKANPITMLFCMYNCTLVLVSHW